jgi:hypothetical protein
MTIIEQHKIIQELREYAGRMSRYEQEEFHMFVKRDKDDEFLDELSQKKLLKMQETYVKSRKPAGNMDEALKALFKKNSP